LRREERRKVLQQMLAHTQYCWTGDNTLQTTASAMREMWREEGGGKERRKGGKGREVL
jgi:hypothetical protein